MPENFGDPLAPGERYRLLRIYRAWHRALRGRAGRWLPAVSFDDTTFGLLAISICLLWPIDGRLWSLAFPFAVSLGISLSEKQVLLLLLLVFLVNAKFLDGAVSRATIEDHSWPRWLRLARFLAAGVPLLGLYVEPGWRWLQVRRPELARDGAAGSGSPPTSSRLRPSWLDARGPYRLRWRWERINRLPALIWLLLVNLAVLFIAGSGLESATNGGHRALLGASVVLHLIFCALALAHFAARSARLPLLRRVPLLASCACWLVPLPFAPIGNLVAAFALGVEVTRSEEIVYQSLIQRDTAARLPLWLTLEDALGRGWSRLPWRQRVWLAPRSAEAALDLGREHGRLLTLYDLRSFALGFDAAALAWGLTWLATRWPTWASSLRQILGLTMLVSIILLAVTLLAFFAHIAATWLRVASRLRVVDEHPYASALAKLQLALLAGLWLGAEIHAGNHREAGMGLMYLSALLITLKGLMLVLRPARRRRRASQHRPSEELTAIVILFVLEFLGGANLYRDLFSPLLVLWVAGAPLWALAVGHSFLPWLLRPFSWREVFSPTLPASLRAALVALCLATLLPFGGLAVPLCIAIRHRRWPSAQAFAWQQRNLLTGERSDG
jgi:hypothetical protein